MSKRENNVAKLKQCSLEELLLESALVEACEPISAGCYCGRSLRGKRTGFGWEGSFATRSKVLLTNVATPMRQGIRRTPACRPPEKTTSGVTTPLS